MKLTCCCKCNHIGIFWKVLVINLLAIVTKISGYFLGYFETTSLFKKKVQLLLFGQPLEILVTFYSIITSHWLSLFPQTKHCVLFADLPNYLHWHVIFNSTPRLGINDVIKEHCRRLRWPTVSALIKIHFELMPTQPKPTTNIIFIDCAYSVTR